MEEKDKSVVANFPTKWGNFRIMVWHAPRGLEPVALLTPNLDIQKPVFVRIHSECMTGDTFDSFLCDCGRQKEKSLEMISKSKNGIFIYLRQEGRDIGLFDKIRTLILQEQGYDTHEANILLGHDPDPREYSVVKKILDQIGIKEIKLITNNPSKENSLRELGFNIIERIPLRVRSNKYNKKYLETKKIKFKHFNNGYNFYSYGINGVEDAGLIESIANHIKMQRLDPYLKINIGFAADKSLLTNNEQKRKLEELFKLTLKHYPPLTPILHYTFKNSNPQDYKKEIMQLKDFHLLKTIQLNDLKKDHLRILAFAAQYFNIIFPINDEYLHLISDPKYRRIVKAKGIFTLLDNSEGKGLEENIGSFEKKITLCLNNGVNDIGIAGGFGPHNLNMFHQLKSYFKINLSIDAETKLKKNGKLNSSLVNIYLDRLLHPKDEV